MTLVKKKQTKAKHAVGGRVEEDAEREKRRKDLGCTTSSWKIPEYWEHQHVDTCKLHVKIMEMAYSLIAK